ncbi:hypothetical protein JIY74_36330, partial [Vibrio harveyi]|nr:hypothetical protein [Vibrio harveyi]
NLLGQLTNQIYKNIKNPITVKEPKTTRIQNEVFCDCVATALITSFCTLGLKPSLFSGLSCLVSNNIIFLYFLN